MPEIFAGCVGVLSFHLTHRPLCTSCYLFFVCVQFQLNYPRFGSQPMVQGFNSMSQYASEPATGLSAVGQATSGLPSTAPIQQQASNDFSAPAGGYQLASPQAASLLPQSSSLNPYGTSIVSGALPSPILAPVPRPNAGVIGQPTRTIQSDASTGDDLNTDNKAMMASNAAHQSVMEDFKQKHLR